MVWTGVQWDGTPETATFVTAWTQGRATLDRRGTMGAVIDGNRHNVGLNDWLMVDVNQVLRIMTEAQVGTLTPVTP